MTKESAFKQSDLDSVVGQLQQSTVWGPEADAQFAQLVAMTTRLGFKLAYSWLGDHSRAEDAVQDAYEIVIRKIGQLRDARAFRAWFCRIVLHCAKSPKFPEIPMERVESPSPPASSPEERLDLARLLRWLPKDDRNVLILREAVDLTYDEIADTLRLPVGTVRSRLFKARKRAMELIKEQNLG